MPIPRDRSTGWQHAKQSGHAYEVRYSQLVMDASTTEHQALKSYYMASGGDSHFIVVEADPTYGRQKVEGFDGRMTQSKTDVLVRIRGPHEFRISLKKPDALGGGQALLLKLQRFSQLCNTGPALDRLSTTALELFTGEAAELVRAHLRNHNPTGPLHSASGMAIERYQNRLYATTLARDFPREWHALTSWMTTNMDWLTSTCLFHGLCASGAGRADLIYPASLGRCISVEELSRRSVGVAPKIRLTGYYAGSTIGLPWGFLQPHRPGKRSGPYQLQFHYTVGAGSTIY